MFGDFIMFCLALMKETCQKPIPSVSSVQAFISPLQLVLTISFWPREVHLDSPEPSDYQGCLCKPVTSVTRSIESQRIDLKIDLVSCPGPPSF